MMITYYLKNHTIKSTVIIITLAVALTNCTSPSNEPAYLTEDDLNSLLENSDNATLELKEELVIDSWIAQNEQFLDTLDAYSFEKVNSYLSIASDNNKSLSLFESRGLGCRIARRVLRKKLCEMPEKLVKNVIRKQQVGSLELSIEAQGLAVKGPSSVAIKQVTSRINVLLVALRDRTIKRCNIIYGGCAPLYIEYHCNDNIRQDKLDDYKRNCAIWYDGREYEKTSNIINSLLIIIKEFQDSELTDSVQIAAINADIDSVQVELSNSSTDDETNSDSLSNGNDNPISTDTLNTDTLKSD